MLACGDITSPGAQGKGKNEKTVPDRGSVMHKHVKNSGADTVV